MSTALYPGTFDPVTNGHLDVLSRATRLFERVIVAVSDENSSKRTAFDTATRVSLVEENLGPYSNASVEAFDGLLVDYARRRGATVLVRGLRAVSDFEYEFQLAGMNRKLYNKVETIFLMSDVENQIISSRFVKEIAQYKGDLKKFTTKSTIKSLKEKYD